MADPSDAVAFLAGSPHRGAILDALREEAVPRRELDEAFDLSRTTLWRILAEFETRGWIVESGDGVALTTRGRLVAEAFEELRRTLCAIESLNDLLEHLPRFNGPSTGGPGTRRYPRRAGGRSGSRRSRP